MVIMMLMLMMMMVADSKVSGQWSSWDRIRYDGDEGWFGIGYWQMLKAKEVEKLNGN